MRSLSRAYTIDDLRRLARRRLPRAVYDFIEGGAGDERTVARNRAAFERLLLEPRVLVDVSKREQATVVLGERVATPVILSPTGMCGLSWPKGEVVAARAAHQAGTIYTLSTHSSCSIEEVAAGAPGPLWFQLYVWQNRDLTRRFVERARAAGYRALLLTVDVPVISRRERDLRNGFTIPPRVTVRNVVDTLRRVGWVRRVLMGPRLTLANLVGMPEAPRTDIVTLAGVANRQVDPSIAWADLAWFRSLWSGPLLLKGVLTAADARRAAEHGVDGLSCRTTADGSSTGLARPWRLCRRSSMRSAAGWRCCWTAASGAGRMWSARSPSGRERSWSAVRTSTAWRPGDRRASGARSRSWRTRSTTRSRSPACPGSPISSRASCAACPRPEPPRGAASLELGGRCLPPRDGSRLGAIGVRIDIRVPVGRAIPEVVEVIARRETPFHGVGVHDHPHSGRDAYVVLALAAVRTRRLHLYPATSSPAVRHPVLLASLAHSLDELGPGRTCLTVAPGFLSARSIGQRRATVDTMREAVVALRRLLAGESVASATRRAG
jgi:L-lactate dehydrogenase (cytochrome)